MFYGKYDAIWRKYEGICGIYEEIIKYEGICEECEERSRKYKGIYRKYVRICGKYEEICQNKKE